ncbi:RING-type domain-containing protein [Pseudozyma hubeiensis]|nr:RING-type domain-containing protein [Pseudozyma hubeiensis]
MLPSLALSDSSIDQFRKNIYRPRLCLLLLVLLLSPYNTTQLSSSSSSDTSEVSVSQPAQSGWAISIIDGLVVAAAPSASSSTLSKPSAKPKQKPKPSKNEKPGPSAAPRSSDAKKKANDADSPESQQSQPAPGSLFRFPKLSWALLIDEHVLPVLLSLHLLWAIRLAAMSVEDGLVKSSLLGSKSRFHTVTLPLAYLGVLAILAVLTGQPAMTAAIRSRCHGWRSHLGFEVLEPSSAEGVSKFMFRADGLLPSSLFVMLETASVLVHVLSILPKVDAPSIASFLPMQLQLPSPSHSPPLIDLLPLPSFVKIALTGPVVNTATARYARSRRPMMPSIRAGPRPNPGAQRQDSGAEGGATANATATTTALGPRPPGNDVDNADDSHPQQVYRRIGAPEDEVLRSTSVARPIAPLRLPETDASGAQEATSSPSSRRRRAPRMRGQSVLVSTKWISETATALFDKITGVLIYSIITLRLPTLSPTSLPPVLSLLSLRSELASMTQIWSKARSSVECLEFVRRRWGVQLEQGQDPYTSVSRPRAAAAAGDYKWKSYDDVYCAICFEQTRSAEAVPDADDVKPHKFEFCRLDCGHELHDICLVSWLTAQAFCPTCHVVLSFSPRPPSTSRRGAVQE